MEIEQDIKEDVALLLMYKSKATANLKIQDVKILAEEICKMIQLERNKLEEYKTLSNNFGM